MIMAYGYIVVVLLGIVLMAAGFYGAFVYNKNKLIANVASIFMPVGLIITLLGILLMVLPNFFKEPMW